MKLSDKIQAIAGSKTVAFTTLIQQLRQEGRKIIDLAVGEPQFDTPVAVIDATKNALDAQKTRYGPVNGITELRTLLAARFSGYKSDNILITNGSKQALFMIFQVICDPADEVIGKNLLHGFETDPAASGMPASPSAATKRLANSWSL